MRTIVLVLIVVALPFAATAAEQPNPPKPVTSTTLTPRSPRTGNPCAEYGAGFVKVEGTSTCVKIGGSVSVGVGGSMPR